MVQMEHPVFRLINIFSFIMKLIFDKNLEYGVIVIFNFSSVNPLQPRFAYSYSLKTSENPIINPWKT